MNAPILMPVSPGEVLDRISILRLKLANIRDTEGKRRVEREFDAVMKSWVASSYSVRPSHEVDRLVRELGAANLRIWAAENILRDLDADDRVKLSAAKLARDANNLRTLAKRAINLELDYDLFEEKVYDREAVDAEAPHPSGGLDA